MEVENKYILKIYEEKSFSRAAQKLFITQPALSIAVKKIESNLGAPIFNRGKYPIEPTEVGIVYIKGLESILEIEKNTLTKINDIKNLEVGSIVIGATNYMNNFVLAPILKIFMEKYPFIKVSLIENSSPKSLELLNENKIDLSFNCGDLELNTYDLNPVFDDEVLLCLPNKNVNKSLLKYRLTKKDIMDKNYSQKRVKLSDFENLKYILLNPYNNLYERSTEMLKTNKSNYEILMYVDQLSTAHSLCKNEIGATFIGSYMLPIEYSENVSYFSLDYNNSHRKFYSVRKKQVYESYAVKNFIRIMQNFYNLK
ncbi:LysR family transcriptional regulator [Peptoniphilus sp. AGMB00490]|uniref:LysR family transcriptional regulator n=2 Tax=Peptoniphilus TaxID=162289 RepID=A0ACD6AZS9_9FIRM|nr:MULTISPECIES: LysR family transcriptional regulator [Peptoniphilus]NMW85304.1 LysR family transcriptional regulator [Peptoniphilus faecalis]OLR65277.1 hypothetical protein BIV18_07005 [Peptoniphilus porci]